MRVALQDLENEPPTSELIALLCNGLGSERWGVRKLAAARLMRIGEVTVPALSELLRTGSADQIYWACQVLARVEPPPARQLQGVLKRPDTTHRRFAVHAFERRTAPDAVEALITALDDPAWELRQRAADALHARLTLDELMELVRSERMRATRNRVYWSVLLLCRRMGAQVIPQVMKLLLWEDDDLRHLVISTLAGLRVEGVGGLLSRYVADRSPVIRREVFDQLVHLGEPVVGPVEEALEAAADGPSRLIFLRVLAKVKPAAFETRCRELLGSRRVEDRYLALDAVGAVHSRRAVTLAVVAFKDTLQAVRRHASETLATLGEAAVPALETAADGRDHDLKFWAIQTLGRMGAPGLAAMRRLLSHEDQETRALVLQAFANIELPDEFLPALLPLLSDGHWPFRKQAAECLSARGPAAARVLMGSALAAEGDERFWSRKVLADLFGPTITHWLDVLETMSIDRTMRVLARFRVATDEVVAQWLSAAPELALPQIEATPLVSPPPIEEDDEPAVPTPAAPVIPVEESKTPTGRFRALSSLIRRRAEMPASPAPLPSLPDPVAPPAAELEIPAAPAALARPKLSPSQPVSRPLPEPDPTPGPVVPREAVRPAPPPQRRVLQPDWSRAEVMVPADPPSRPAPANPVSVPAISAISNAEALDQLAQLVRHLEEAGGSEMHLKVGAPPVVKVVDRMVQLGGAAQTTEFLAQAAEAIGAAGAAVTQVCVDLEGAGRCRVRVAREARGPALMIRPLGTRPPTLETVGKEPQLESLKSVASGLILISGGAASGRTWTAAALLNAINATRPVPITSVEAPVEHVNYPQPGFLSLVSVPADFPTNRAALDYALACGAGVIAVADIGDRDSAALALEAAASGTLVIGIMRSTGALDALEQLVAVAGPERSRTLSLLATALRASIYQVLLPHATERRLVPAREFVMGTQDVARHLMHGRFNELRDRMAAKGNTDVRSLAEATAELQKKGVLARK